MLLYVRQTPVCKACKDGCRLPHACASRTLLHTLPSGNALRSLNVSVLLLYYDKSFTLYCLPVYSLTNAVLLQKLHCLVVRR